MINKLTLEQAYKKDPYKSYFAIKNPKINDKKRKVYGLKHTIVEYKLKDWDSKEYRFEKVNQEKNKSFPTIIVFDNRQADAENTVYHVVKKTKKKKEKQYIKGIFALFLDEQSAQYNKLIRLHDLATELSEIHNTLKQQKKDGIKPYSKQKDTKNKAVKPTDAKDNKGAIVPAEAVAEIKEGTKVSTIPYKIKNIIKYFNDIQQTGYYELLDEIQIKYPDLMTK